MNRREVKTVFKKEPDNETVQAKLCEKVAELAQVVHLLFVSNHKKQMEIDCLVDAYENEISRVIDDAQNWVKSNEGTSVEHKRKAEECAAELEHCRHELQLLTEQYDQLKDREYRSANELSEVKEECQKLRDLLINGQNDLQCLRANLESKLKEKEALLSQRDGDLERMGQKISWLDASLMDTQKSAERSVKMAQKRVRNVEQELDKMRLEVKSAHKSENALMERQKCLERELKECQKTAENRIAELVAAYNTIKSEEKMESKYTSSATNNKDCEVEILKKELQRYRLELSNRDKNFSQMFVPVSHGLGSGGVTPAAAAGMAQRGTLIVDKRAGLLAKQFAVCHEGNETISYVGKIPPLHAERRSSLILNNNNYNSINNINIDNNIINKNNSTNINIIPKSNQRLITNFACRKSSEVKIRRMHFLKHSQTVTSFRGK